MDFLLENKKKQLVPLNPLVFVSHSLTHSLIHLNYELSLIFCYHTRWCHLHTFLRFSMLANNKVADVSQ